MTEKQINFIDSLLKQRDYDLQDSLVQAYINNFNLSTLQASQLISYLLECDKKAYDPYRKLKADIAYSARHPKVKKHVARMNAIQEVLGRYVNKNTEYTVEELEAIKHIFA